MEQCRKLRDFFHSISFDQQLLEKYLDFFSVQIFSYIHLDSFWDFWIEKIKSSF